MRHYVAARDMNVEWDKGQRREAERLHFAHDSEKEHEAGGSCRLVRPGAKCIVPGIPG